MIGIVDLGISNIRNICRFFDNINKDYLIIQNVKDFNKVNILVLPGVGSFGSGINQLNKKNYISEIINFHKSGKLLIGVCLGMQLMMQKSDENYGIAGLCLLNHSIKKINYTDCQKKIHVGWNELKTAGDHNNLFKRFDNKSFYFTHSFFLDSIDSKCFGKTKFNDDELISFFIKDNIVGCQFHLELSGKNGFNLMNKILEYEKSL